MAFLAAAGLLSVPVWAEPSSGNTAASVSGELSGPEIIMERVCSIMEESATLMNECHSGNADAQAEKLHAAFAEIRKLKSALEQFFAQHPEAAAAFEQDIGSAQRLDIATRQLETAVRNLEEHEYFGSAALEDVVNNPFHGETATPENLSTATPVELYAAAARSLDDIADLLGRCNHENADQMADLLEQKFKRMRELMQAVEQVPSEVKTELQQDSSFFDGIMVSVLQYESALRWLQSKNFFGSEKLRQVCENGAR